MATLAISDERPDGAFGINADKYFTLFEEAMEDHDEFDDEIEDEEDEEDFDDEEDDEY